MSFNIFVKSPVGMQTDNRLTGLNGDTTVSTAMQLHHKLNGGPHPDDAIWMFGGAPFDKTMTLEMAGIGEASVINCSSKTASTNVVDFHAPEGVVSAQLAEAK